MCDREFIRKRVCEIVKSSFCDDKAYANDKFANDKYWNNYCSPESLKIIKQEQKERDQKQFQKNVREIANMIISQPKTPSSFTESPGSFTEPVDLQKHEKNIKEIIETLITKTARDDIEHDEKVEEAITNIEKIVLSIPRQKDISINMQVALCDLLDNFEASVNAYGFICADDFYGKHPDREKLCNDIKMARQAILDFCFHQVHR